MQPYKRTQETREKNANVAGIVATAVIHVLALLLCLFLGLSYLDPPPPERTTLLIDFEAELPEEEPVQTRIGREPQAEVNDPDRPVELVREAQSPFVNDRPNTAPVQTPDAHGDVDVPTPQEPQINPNALFPGMSDNSSNATAPHSATEASDGFRAGQPDGNTREGRISGNANAHLQGRHLEGSLPKPRYNAQLEGIVVVQIKVDQYGNVTEAVAGVEGTTVHDATLWNAARSAAMQAHFNMSADAPVLQTGTITYIFKLQ